jgi:hypothetical protein
MQFSRNQIQTAMTAAGYSFGEGSAQEQRRRDFRAYVGGANFLTPEIAGIYRLKAKPYVLVEVSTGEFMNKPLIGCTVVDRAAGCRMDEAGGCVESLEALAEKFAELERLFS